MNQNSAIAKRLQKISFYRFPVNVVRETFTVQRHLFSQVLTQNCSTMNIMHTKELFNN